MILPKDPEALADVLEEFIIAIGDETCPPAVRLESQLHELGHVSTLWKWNQDDLLSEIVTEHLVAGALSNEDKQDSPHHECLAAAMSILLAQRLCPDIATEIQKISESNIGMNIPHVLRNGVPVRGVADPVAYMRKLVESPAARSRADRLVDRITNTIKECLEQGDTT